MPTDIFESVRSRAQMASAFLLLCLVSSSTVSLAQVPGSPLRQGQTSPVGQAQMGATLSLPQAVSEFEQSPRVKRAKSEVEEAKWKSVEMTAPFFPTFSANATYLIEHQYVVTNIAMAGFGSLAIPNIIPTSTYGVSGQWLLFDGLANIERFQGSKATELAQKEDLDWTRFAGQREVVLAYYRALAAKILENVSEQNVKTLEDHLRDVQLFKRTGVTTKYDVLRVEVQSSEAHSDLLNSKDNVAVTQLRLGETLGHEKEDREPTGELPILTAELISKVLGAENNQANLQERGDIKALQDRVNGLEKMARAADKHWVPQVSLGGQYLRYDNLSDNFADWGDYRDSWTLGVQLNWNLFDGFASTAKDHEAMERKVQAQESLEITRIHARNDIEYWKRRFVYFCSVYQSRISDVEKSAESVRLAREGRRVGIRTTTDTLDAELELFRARAGVVNSQIGSIEALINLELATGQQLYSFN